MQTLWVALLELCTLGSSDTLLLGSVPGRSSVGTVSGLKHRSLLPSWADEGRVSGRALLMGKRTPVLERARVTSLWMKTEVVDLAWITLRLLGGNPGEKGAGVGEAGKGQIVLRLPRMALPHWDLVSVLPDRRSG